MIVGSILLAFGIQAWWDETQERAEERQALQALIQDFEAASNLLERHHLQIDTVAGASEILLGWTGPNADSEHADSLASLIWPIIQLPSFEPPLGTLEALLGSGDLSLIRSDELRAALAAFPSQLAGMRRTQDYGAELVFNQVLPYLDRVLPMRRFAAVARGPTEFEVDVSRVLRSMEFENLIQNMLMNAELKRRNAGAMETRIDSLLEMLQADLSR